MAERRSENTALSQGQQPRQSDHPVEVQAENLHKSFGDHAVLKGVNLTVRQGELVAIVGGSGSGKSVLFKHLIGLVKPDQGRGLVADHETSPPQLIDLAEQDEAALEKIRQRCGVIFQQNALYSGTVSENVTLALQEVQGMEPPQAEETARAAIESVGLNVEQVWDQDRDHLSGGMAKRIAIARALALDPILIFYDEPTTGLDPESASHIYDLIKSTNEKPGPNGIPRTSLIITHDKDLLFKLQPRIALLHDGQVSFDGTYDQFARSNSPVIKPYFEIMPSLHFRHRPRG